MGFIIFILLVILIIASPIAWLIAEVKNSNKFWRILLGITMFTALFIVVGGIIALKTAIKTSDTAEFIHANREVADYLSYSPHKDDEVVAKTIEVLNEINSISPYLDNDSIIKINQIIEKLPTDNNFIIINKIKSEENMICFFLSTIFIILFPIAWLIVEFKNTHIVIRLLCGALTIMSIIFYSGIKYSRHKIQKGFDTANYFEANKKVAKFLSTSKAKDDEIVTKSIEYLNKINNLSQYIEIDDLNQASKIRKELSILYLEAKEKDEKNNKERSK
ncbi:hypothetical protein AAEX28_06280 [Lentisphaerota bacterium WC36G]|nr:hypothetical protein LJT99_09145 [Lentisphaerae bacterium WC36]